MKLKAQGLLTSQAQQAILQQQQHFQQQQQLLRLQQELAAAQPVAQPPMPGLPFQLQSSGLTSSLNQQMPNASQASQTGQAILLQHRQQFELQSKQMQQLSQSQLQQKQAQQQQQQTQPAKTPTLQSPLTPSNLQLPQANVSQPATPISGLSPKLHPVSSDTNESNEMPATTYASDDTPAITSVPSTISSQHISVTSPIQGHLSESTLTKSTSNGSNPSPQLNIQDGLNQPPTTNQFKRLALNLPKDEIAYIIQNWGKISEFIQLVENALKQLRLKFASLGVQGLPLQMMSQLIRMFVIVKQEICTQLAGINQDIFYYDKSAFQTWLNTLEVVLEISRPLNVTPLVVNQEHIQMANKQIKNLQAHQIRFQGMQQQNPLQQTSRQLDQRTQQVNHISLPASQIMSTSLLQQQFRLQSHANTPGASPNVTNEMLMSPRNQNEQLHQAQQLTNLQFQQNQNMIQQQIAQLNSVPSPPRPSPIIPSVQPSPQLTNTHTQNVLSRSGVQNGAPFMNLTGTQDINGMVSFGGSGLIQGMQPSGLMRNSANPKVVPNFIMQQSSQTPHSTIGIASQLGIVNPLLSTVPQSLNSVSSALDVKRSPKSDLDLKDVKTVHLSSSPKTPSQVNTPPPSSPSGNTAITTSHFPTPQSTGNVNTLITPPPSQPLPVQHLSSSGMTMTPYSINNHSDQIRQLHYQHDIQNQQRQLQAAFQQQAQLQAHHQFQQQQMQQQQLHMQQQISSQQLAMQQIHHPIHMNPTTVLNQQNMNQPIQRLFQQSGPNAIGPVPLQTQQQQPNVLPQGIAQVTIPNPAFQRMAMPAAIPSTTLVNNVVSDSSTNPSNIESVSDQIAQLLEGSVGQFDQNFAHGSLTNDDVNESDFFDFDFEESLQETEPALLSTSQSPQVPANALSTSYLLTSSPLAHSNTQAVHDSVRPKRSHSDVDEDHEGELVKREKTARSGDKKMAVVANRKVQIESSVNEDCESSDVLDNADTLALKQEVDGADFLQF
ncbi:hypothetical protein HK096_003298 [Nowakowskiella sp. JEL0078]|nr:hypothetical protein HK096_003298 [Nowakowskiella sp. JEL0078]